MIFRKVGRNGVTPDQGNNSAFLRVNNWDDYSYKTLFYLTVFDGDGVKHDIGDVKIGYVDQPHGWTEEQIPDQFENLGEVFFSLGQSAEYYQNIQKNLSQELAHQVLIALRDVANDEVLLESINNEQVFGTSLLRGVSRSAIHGQYRRLLSGGSLLTEFNFSYIRPANDNFAGFDLSFQVAPNSKPSTNIHVLIGRNGVGKTTLLNNMVSSIIDNQPILGNTGRFYDNSSSFLQNQAISEDYFSSVTSISFSAFDPFIPPPNRVDRSQGICHFYIGLKKVITEDGERKIKLKELPELCDDFVNSVRSCLSLTMKKERWLSAILKLESDMNFADMGLPRLASLKDLEFDRAARSLFTRMSSGHAVVLLSITKLVETVEEKTLVLIDEPESHLHPPLLSAFTRALSDLLINRNGVAIIATHSPVVLQEIPKSAVWKLRRTRLVGNSDRPDNETFGENVGVLTREIFGLEVSKSGFHELLEKSVAEGKGYDQILSDYKYQLGFEGQAILRVLIATRDSQVSEQ